MNISSSITRILDRAVRIREAQAKHRRSEAEQLQEDQSNGFLTAVSDPRYYTCYLTVQGGNTGLDVGNAAIVAMDYPDAQEPRTLGEWKKAGRMIKAEEWDRYTKALLPEAAQGDVPPTYHVGRVYDIRQTTGKTLDQHKLKNNSPDMEKALLALNESSPVPFVGDVKQKQAARYDHESGVIVVNPRYKDQEIFQALSAEITHACFGQTQGERYSREAYDLDAQSVGYLMARRFGIKPKTPDVFSLVTEQYRGAGPQEIRESLDTLRDLSNKIGNKVDRGIHPPQKQRVSPVRTAKANAMAR